jgi:hypothetical protein
MAAAAWAFIRGIIGESPNGRTGQGVRHVFPVICTDTPAL